MHKKIIGLVDECYDETYNIAHEKNSSSMVEKGLFPAVELVARRIEETNNLKVTVTNIDLEEKIKNSIELHLFRIIQELLANAVKHSGATQVTIQFSQEDGQLNMIFEDDGQGFNINEVTFGLGLSNIETRVRKMNGAFHIDASPDNGTTVIIKVPI